MTAFLTGFSTDRSLAEDLDAADPLAGLRDRFACPEPGLIYLDGNSLGMLPRVTAQRIGEVVAEQWGDRPGAVLGGLGQPAAAGR